MSQEPTPLAVKISGELACFTRPEMKVERVSYPVMTPTAAKGILESIFWKPEFRWQVDEVQVLNPIRYASITRNEINQRQTLDRAREWQKSGGGFAATEKENRAQRHTLALRDVAYVIKAQAVMKDESSEPAKYRDQFRRRVNSGRCFAIPYLGCREFSAKFEAPDGTETPIGTTEDLGYILLNIDYPHDGASAKPCFFQAHLEKGVMKIPR